MTQPQTPFETPELDEAIQKLALEASRNPQERETLARELLLLKERLWQTPFYRKRLVGTNPDSGANFLYMWRMASPPHPVT